MKHKIRNPQKSGVSLIEIIVATAILAIIAVPVLNLFAASTRNTVISGNITAGSFICQKEMERLIKLDYFSLLSDSSQYYDSNNILIQKNATTYGYPQITYTIRIKPSGVHNDLLTSTENAEYAHMVFYSKPGNTSRILSIFYPDGRYNEFNPSGVTVTITSLTSVGGVAQNNISAGSGASTATKTFSSKIGTRLIFINNLTRISNVVSNTAIRYISYTKTPYSVFYANDQASINMFPVTPTPVTGKNLNFIGGDLYDKMLVDVEVTAYFVQGSSKTEIARIKDTISPRIVIT